MAATGPVIGRMDDLPTGQMADAGIGYSVEATVVLLGDVPPRDYAARALTTSVELATVA